jgi:hypothetical protein
MPAGTFICRRRKTTEPSLKTMRTRVVRNTVLTRKPRRGKVVSEAASVRNVRAVPPFDYHPNVPVTLASLVDR